MFNHYVLLIVILIFFTNCGADCNCSQNGSLDYLDAAADFIAKAKSNYPSQVICENNKGRKPLDCSELLEMGYKKNGVYIIWPESRILDHKLLEVYCDMETDGGGWTLIQRRGRFAGKAEDFYRDWKTFKEGFGDIQKEFWLGNDNIFTLTNQGIYSARFDLRTLDNKNMHAHYDTFWINAEYYKYTLHIANYTGDAGDAMAYHHSKNFSASDSNLYCISVHRGGWWYGVRKNDCVNANLNGRHMGNEIIWNYLNESKHYLQSTEIKIRPRNFKLPQASLDNTPMR